MKVNAEANAGRNDYIRPDLQRALRKQSFTEAAQVRARTLTQMHKPSASFASQAAEVEMCS